MIAVVYIDLVLSATCQHCLYHQPRIRIQSVTKGREKGGGLDPPSFRNFVDGIVRPVRPLFLSFSLISFPLPSHVVTFRDRKSVV